MIGEMNTEQYRLRVEVGNADSRQEITDIPIHDPFHTTRVEIGWWDLVKWVFKFKALTVCVKVSGTELAIRHVMTGPVGPRIFTKEKE